MSAEPETTLAWAEFLWRVVREAPETASLYIALFLFWRHSREKGRHLTLELSDSATASDSLTIRVPAATARALMPTPTVRVSRGDQAVLDSMAELDPDFPQF